MKKILMMMSMLSASVMLFAAEVKVNADFSGSVVGKPMPAGWLKNFKWEKNVGKTAVIKNGDKFALTLKTTDLRTPIYSATEVPVKPGDVFDFSARFKGQGRVQFFFYGYSANGAFLCEKNTTLSQIAGEKVLTGKLKVEAIPGKVLTKVCVGFEAANNSDVVVSDLKIEKNAPQAK